MFKISSVTGRRRRKTIKTISYEQSCRICWIDNENVVFQPEGYNPSGSFKDNGMSAAVTHGKMMGAKKLFVHLQEIHLHQQECLQQMKTWNVMFTFQMVK